MRWRIVAHPEILGTHQWSVYAGLAGLVRSGEASVTWKALRPTAARAAFLMEVKEVASGAVRLVAFEMHDGADLNPWHADNADVVFKRSYDPARREGDYAQAAAMVRPMGLTISCNGPGVPRLAVRGAFTRAAEREGRTLALPPRQVLTMLGSAARSLASRIAPRLVPSVPEPQSFYESFAGGQIGAPSVTFLVRAWDPKTATTSSQAGFASVSEGRAQLIRLLRKELGPRFVGGFVPSEFVATAYPDCVADVSTSRRDFIGTVAKCGIGISTVGLGFSNPWKLAEYMATGTAIITEPLRRELPEQLVEGRDLLEFATPDECVVRCLELLDSPERLAALRAASAAYWLAYVRTDELLRRRLGEAFDNPA